MKRLIVLLCLALASAQDVCLQQQNIANNGECLPITANTLPCRDACSGVLIESVANCSLASHCCLQGRSCILKTIIGTGTVTLPSVNLQSLQAELQEDLNEAGINVTEDIAPRNLFLGGGLPFGLPVALPGGLPGGSPGGFPGAFHSVCPTFPNNCQVQYGGQADITLPVNVPYCQRIPCSPLNPLLEQDVTQCVRQPGCSFDFQLYQHRSILNQAVLPGVPVCHLAIRNKAFHRRANEYVRQYGSWNPLLTKCLIQEYKTEIYGASNGCYMVDVIEHFGHHAKRAGWKSINEPECYLIGGCWRVSSKEPQGFCVYPLELQKIKVRSNNEDRIHNSDPSVLFGLPSCLPFSPSLTGAEFLSAYHTCLATGCAVNVDRNTYLQQLYSLGSGLPLYLQPEYYKLILSGEVRPDNYQTILDKLPTTFGLPTAYPTNPNSFGPHDPFVGLSLNISSNQGRNLQIPFLGGSGPSNGQNHLANILAGFSGQGQHNTFQPGIPSYQPQCPYRKINYPHLPPLTGSFEDCCKKPLCYIPREQLYTQYSGISSYLTEWSNWSECSASCGGGRQTRTRSCVGKECSDNSDKEQIRTCGESQCPYYGSWSRYSICSATCGGGVKTRSRVCHGSGPCSGPDSESTPCRTGDCPTLHVGEWSNCNVEYGQGQRQRTISCINGGGYPCPSDRTEYDVCHIYVGNVVHGEGTCNPRTCLKSSVPRCVKDDGSEGYCPQDDMAPNTVRCIDNFQCYCRAYPGSFGCNQRRPNFSG